MQYLTGYLHYWNEQSGYGFAVDSEGIRYFAPVSNFVKSFIPPQPGLAVKFIPGRNHRGLVAVNIEIDAPRPTRTGGAK